MSLGYRLVRKVGFLLRLRLEAEPSWIWRAAVILFAEFIRLLGWTLRYRIVDHPGYFSGELAEPAILVLWHNRIIATPPIYERFARRKRGAVVLTSAGPEGSLLALFLSQFGIGAVRGSTSRRASTALRELAGSLREGVDVMITPDGPRGPRYRLQPGALFLAQRTGAPILPVQVEYAKYRRFKTWDGFAIPLPFARVELTIGQPFLVAPNLSEEEFESERRRLEALMTDSLRMD